MSLKDLYNTGNRNDSGSTVNCYSVTTDQLTAITTITANDIVATNNVSAGNDVLASNNVEATNNLVASGNVSAVDANLSGKLNLSSKYFSPSTALPATIAIDELQGVITVTGSLPSPSQSPITLTNPNILADSTCLITMGPSATTSNLSLDVGIVSVGVGQIDLLISNNSGGMGVAPYVFTYLIC